MGFNGNIKGCNPYLLQIIFLMERKPKGNMTVKYLNPKSMNGCYAPGIDVDAKSITQ